MGVREFVEIIKEDTYGVAKTSPGSTDKIYIMLPQDNACTVRRHNANKDIVSAGRTGRRVHRESRTYNVSGNLSTMLYPSQAAFWLDILFNPVVSGNCSELRSFTLIHGFILEGGTCAFNVNQYLGCKADATLSASDEGQNVTLALAIVGSQAAHLADGDYAVPGTADVPETLNSYGFQDSVGLITWGLGSDGTASTGAATVRTLYTSFELATNNVFSPIRAETPYLQANYWKGRNPTLTIDNVYRSTQDRIDYASLARRAASVGLNFGGNILTLNLGSNNYMGEPADDLKMAGVYMQKIVIDNFLDTTTGSDIVATFTPYVAP